MASFAALGLTLPAVPTDKPVFVEFGPELWWLNQDSRGGVWINGREKKEGETAGSARESEGSSEPSPAQPAPTAAPAPADAPSSAPAAANPESASTSSASTASPLSAVRLLLQPTRTGGVAGKLERLAGEIGKAPEEFLAALTGAGLKVPEKAREKPVFIEHAGEIFWLNKNAKDELWLNAKASKFADKPTDGEAGEKKPRRGRTAKKPD